MIHQRMTNSLRSSFCVAVGRTRREEWGGSKGDDGVTDERGGGEWRGGGVCDDGGGTRREPRASDDELGSPLFSIASH